MKGGPVQTSAFLLEGRCGKLFCVYRRGTQPRNAVLIVPPFAEEMNKARRMLTLQSQALAERGWAVLAVDLYGTGDSSGGFDEARWDVWVQDLCSAIRWLTREGCDRYVLLGLRLGALLALETGAAADVAPDRVILWQPLLQGKQAIDLLLRTRVVESMGEGKQLSSRELRTELQRDGRVTLGGYALSSTLVHGIEAAQLVPAARRLGRPLFWVEVAAEAGRTISEAGRKALTAIRDGGVDAELATVAGPAFWATAEISEAPELIAATTQCLCR